MKKEETIYIWYRKTCCTPVAWNLPSQSNLLQRATDLPKHSPNWLKGFWMVFFFLSANKIMNDHCFTLLRYPTYIDFTSDFQFHISGQIKKCYFRSRLPPFNQAVLCKTTKGVWWISQNHKSTLVWRFLICSLICTRLLIWML